VTIVIFAVAVTDSILQEPAKHFLKWNIRNRLAYISACSFGVPLRGRGSEGDLSCL